MEYQWYPGHMTRARRMMEENLKLVDLVIELADARIPVSSRNPDIDRLCAGKPRILVLTKADLADPSRTERYRTRETGREVRVLSMDARKKADVSMLRSAVADACSKRAEKDRSRGIVSRPLRAMVVGIPNVGKSTLINSLVGRASAKTGNHPGVTRGKQWISLQGSGGSVQFLDTPGILWPKFEDRETGIRLAAAGTLNDDILDLRELAGWLLSWLSAHYPEAVPSRYGIREENFSGDTDEFSENPEGLTENLKEFPESPEQIFAIQGGQTRETKLLRAIAVKRGILRKGGAPDEDRAAALLLDDYRSGRLGRISLE